jgi:hypothetical protein
VLDFLSNLLPRRTVALLCLAMLASVVMAADAPFTLALSGGGRACAGGLFVRAKTLEWNTSFSRCAPTPYTVLEKEVAGDRTRVVFRLLKRGSGCRYAIVEAEQQGQAGWNVSGYPSLEVYENQHLPDWRNSPLERRQVLSCPMY